jgi:hypothetical protein
MPDTIRDGKGRGYVAEVNSQNQISVAAVSVSKEHYVNLRHEDAYNFLFSHTSMDTTSACCIVYMQNTSAENIICEGMIIRCTGDQVFTIKVAESGNPIGGTDIIPANLNAGSNKLAAGVFQCGCNITGLSGGREIIKLYTNDSYIESKSWNFDADIVIPQNQTLSIYITNPNVNIDGFIVFFHDHNGN